MPVSIKICGLADEPAVKAALSGRANFAGFVHFPSSPRHVTLERAVELREMLPSSVRSVCVLVDPDDALMERVQSMLSPDFVQLHGQETPQRLHQLRKLYPALQLIKALRVASSDDIAQAGRYLDCADMLLFDAKPPKLPGMLPGGNGLAFDWALIRGRDFTLPWFLSGGLNAENVREAIETTGAQMIDVSSGVELSPGAKDAALVEAFTKAARAA